jgi:hypothetical protein
VGCDEHPEQHIFPMSYISLHKVGKHLMERDSFEVIQDFRMVSWVDLITRRPRVEEILASEESKEIEGEGEAEQGRAGQEDEGYSPYHAIHLLQTEQRSHHDAEIQTSYSMQPDAVKYIISIGEHMLGDQEG